MKIQSDTAFITFSNSADAMKVVEKWKNCCCAGNDIVRCFSFCLICNKKKVLNKKRLVI